MAATMLGATLTEAQRLDQARIAKATQTDVLKAWPLLDPRNVDQTSPAWVQTVMTLIGLHRRTSAQSAAAYYQQLRQTETDQVVPHPLVLASGIDTARVATSLLVTGPIGIKQRLAKGMDPDKAARFALVESTGAATRHALDGGRQTLVDAVESDSAAVGFARVTGPNPCAFCAMLASRGFAYKSRESALSTGRRSKLGIGQKYHDHCQCTVEPAFSHGAPLPPGSQQYADLWAQATRGKSGKAATSAFAQALDDAQGHSDGPDSAVAATEHHAEGEGTPAKAKKPRAMRDAELEDAMSQAAADSDMDLFEKLAEESDRREAAKAQRQERDQAKREQADAEKWAHYEQLTAKGVDEESAVEAAYGLSVEEQRKTNAVSMLRGQGYVGRDFRELSKQSYADHVYGLWLQAEEDCRGALLTPAGERAGINPRSLFVGQEARARKWASEELRAWWDENGRPTYEEWQSYLLGEPGAAMASTSARSDFHQ